MRQYLRELMPLIVDALLDGAAANKREVAVATLGQVVQSTGCVITHPPAPVILHVLRALLVFLYIRPFGVIFVWLFFL